MFVSSFFFSVSVSPSTYLLARIKGLFSAKKKSIPYVTRIGCRPEKKMEKVGYKCSIFGFPLSAYFLQSMIYLTIMLVSLDSSNLHVQPEKKREVGVGNISIQVLKCQ